MLVVTSSLFDLIDGTYELFRHYYAVPSAREADGREVGAVRGVLASIFALHRSGASHLDRDRSRDRIVPQCAPANQSRSE